METILVEYLTEYGVVTILVSFLIGIISSLNPCSVLTLPFFIASSITLSKGLNSKAKKIFIYNYTFLFFIGLVVSYSVLLLLFTQIGTMLRVSSSWMYTIAGILTLLIVAYSLNMFGSLNKNKLTEKLIPYKYLGALIIGFVHGFITSPCGSAPFIALLTLASQTGWLTSYTLVLSFAVGQAMILLVSGLFVGFIQNIRANKWINVINTILNKIFIIVLILIGIYFIYKGYLSF